MQRRIEIDGLRALAVIPVILFHAGYESFKGGYVGVDIFFVISGFLITKIILDDLEKGTFSLIDFYKRRARRILPALFFVVIISLPFAWLLMTPAEIHQFSNSVIAVSLFISNFFFYLQDNYFTATAEMTPLLHTWSLAVEEQYYIVFPIIMSLFWVKFRSRTVLAIIAVTLVSLVLAELAWRKLGISGFYLTPMRAWELLIGALVAIFIKELTNKPKLLEQLLSLFGLALILLAIFTFDSQTPYPSIYTLLPTLGAALVIVYANEKTLVGKALSNRLMVGIGLISYSLYLWHQPVFAFFRLAAFDISLQDAMFALCVSLGALSFISWKFVEQPFRKGNLLVGKQTLLASVVASFLLIAVGVVGRTGWFGTMYQQQFDFIDGMASVYGGENYEFGRHVYGKENVKPSFILYGDSHAHQYISALEGFAKINNTSFISITKSACLSLPGVTNLWNGEIRKSCVEQLNLLDKEVRKNKLPVIIAYRWTKKLVGSNVDKKITSSISDIRGQKLIFGGLDKLLEMPEPYETVVVIGNVPSSNLLTEGGYTKCVFRKLGECSVNFEVKKGELFELRKIFNDYAMGKKELFFIDPYKELCTTTQCKVLDEDKLIYSDHAHLSKHGASLVIMNNSSLLKSLFATQ
jgi:peptidoglycan/LPS O-acetylase OafA/YrhL